MKRFLFLVLTALVLVAPLDARRRFTPPSSSSVTPTKLEFSTQPSGAVTSTNFTQQPVVRAVDALGNLATGYSGNVTVAKINGAGTLVGTATVAASGGVATFSGLQWNTQGHYVLGASASGLTSVRSGMMTTVPSTTVYNQASRNFGGGTTADKGDCGSAASLDDLEVSSGFTVVFRARFHDVASTNLFQVSKIVSGTAGWQVQLTGGTIYFAVGRSTTNAVSLSTDVLTQDVWYDICVRFDPAAGGRKALILKALAGAPVANVTYNGSFDGIGSGTINGDAAAKLFIGNLELTGVNPAKADIAWCAVFSGLLGGDGIENVRTGFNRNDPASINAAGTCVMLQRINGTGTLTDLSTVGTNNCAITGTTTGGTSDFCVPVMPDNSIDPTNSTNYWFTNAFATYSYTTTATSAIVTAYRTLEAAYDAQASITVLVDGVYQTQFLVTTIAENNFGTVSLPAGSKTVTFVNGTRSRAVGAPAEGTFLTSIQFNASATDHIPDTPSSTLLYFGDSILADFVTTPVGQYGSTNLMRDYLSAYRSVMIEGYGGAALKDYATDSTAIAETVATIARYNPNFIFTELGANDYQGERWSPTAYQAAWTDLLAALHAEMPNLVVYLSTMVTRPNEGPIPAVTGYYASQFRTAAANAGAAANVAAGTTFVYIFDGPTQLWNGTNSGDGGSHPNNTGAAAILANEKTNMGL